VDTSRIGSGVLGIIITERGQIFTVWIKEPVVEVDVVEVVHETERGVVLDHRVGVEVSNHLGSELPNVIHGGLVATVEILASELGNLEVKAERRPLFEIGYETLRADVVVVDIGHVGVIPASFTLGNVRSDPVPAVGSRSCDMARKFETHGLVWLDYIVPNIDALLNRHIGLIRLVDLVATPDFAGIARRDGRLERLDPRGFVTPELDAERNTTRPNDIRNVLVP